MGKKEKKLNKFMICNQPKIKERPLGANVSPHREFLIRYIEKKWVNNTVLHYCFLDSPVNWRGDEDQKQVVREAFHEWKGLGIGLEFKEVNNPRDAEVRIGFEQGAGSWSYVGRDIIDYVTNPQERTMNFGWDLTKSGEKDTALHEIGHTLGFPHEHQNPNTGIIWDEEAVYKELGGYPNYWDRDKTYHNIIRKISSEEVSGSNWDKNSVMHYPFKKGLIKMPEKYQTEPLIPKGGLSDIDIAEVRKFYPLKEEVKIKKLKPYLSKIMDIKPGEQLDFLIEPEVSRKYTIQTFGELDTLIVLFEDVNGEPIRLTGDDDSGNEFNAKLELPLLKGRKYYLRARLYFSDEKGKGAIMIW